VKQLAIFCSGSWFCAALGGAQNGRAFSDACYPGQADFSGQVSGFEGRLDLRRALQAQH
jgi:hypothetical protein